MRLPLSWLRDFVAFDGTPEQLADRLVTSGFEIEGVLRPGAPNVDGNHGAFVIGRVVHFEKHPNADRLRLCQVDTGDPEPRQIVCGASNFAAGDTVVVALPGARLPGSDAPLKQAKLRGEVSNGMMLSERELGLSDDHDGIIVLPESAGFPVGSLLADHVELDEVVLDVSVESNRGDCLSVYGMAREVAVLFDLELAPVPGVEPPASTTVTADLITIGIAAPDRCTRFVARGFDNVVVGPSPFRVRQRLAAAGIRPISNIVDATNYVMHELGNPLHAYDADRVAGRTLSARLAADGERIVTLDGKERVLSTDMLVIADASGPAAIAGVMGGAASEIRSDTTRVVLEAACFERSGIQRASAALGLRTDGSNRWEKGVSPYLAPVAATRAAELIVEWSGAAALAAPLDEAGQLPARQAVTVRRKAVENVLGLAIPDTATQRILHGLGYEPNVTGDGWECAVPFWRWLDAVREIDLVEEVGRVHGLEHVPSELPRIPPGAGGLTGKQSLRRLVEDHLAGLGLTEVVNLSLTDPDVGERYGLESEVVALRNPLSADLSELRSSLRPGLVDVVVRNRSAGTRDFQAYEIGRVYAPPTGDLPADERTMLGIVVAGAFGGSTWLGSGMPCDFHAIVSVVDSLLARVGVVSARRPASEEPMMHPGRAATLSVGDHVIGVLGELHPGLAAGLDLDVPIALAEIDLDALAAVVPGNRSFSPFSTFPPVRQDIAIVVDDEVDAGTVIDVVRNAGGELLVSCLVFDVFADAERLGVGRTSMGVSLEFRAMDRTLEESEATAVRNVIVSALEQACGAELRA